MDNNKILNSIRHKILNESDLINGDRLIKIKIYDGHQARSKVLKLKDDLSNELSTLNTVKDFNPELTPEVDFNYPNIRFLEAVDHNDEILGGAFIIIKNNIVILQDILIDKKFRGRNIGKTLIDKTEEIAKSNGCSKVVLYVLADNIKAQQFYYNTGFKDFSKIMYKKIK